MAIVAATPFIAKDNFEMLEMGEKACSGTLNLAFSSMVNLVGIGAIAIVVMIWKGRINKDEAIPASLSTKLGLIFYIVASTFLSIFIMDGIISYGEAWFFMIFGIIFLIIQFIVPRLFDGSKTALDDDSKEDKTTPEITKKPFSWSKELLKNGFLYAFLIFGLWIFVRESLGATFKMASVGLFSVGGILLMFTSYISSFPEQVMAVQYAISDKKDELLALLFGSNVINLAFAGFRAIKLREPMEVYTTGRFPELLPAYIWALPAVAVLLLLGLFSKKLKWKHAYWMVAFFLIYIISGLILL